MSDLKQTLYLIADEMRGMASVGKYFSQNIYEQERAERLMRLAAQLAAAAGDEPIEDVERVFLMEPWLRASPAIGVDAAVFDEEDRILLIQRADNQRWAMPGGLAEIGQTLSEAVLRELWEEAGLRGVVKRVLQTHRGFCARNWMNVLKYARQDSLLAPVYDLPYTTPSPNMRWNDAESGRQNSRQI